ncbi:helix-turn-helix transcriptional regulator [Pseudonocardia acidicola]|uniref:Helix-turn-helix transcriptional regulator n=1 Tax=Pseudonocardia acidicola TaxID=2724939 RepID=A0ABX1S3K5_9PSEU|nr:helix-turn-helix transcriptional regulator [Pseudonocardia acidicola]NMH96159.1 helix-turn-helix transcriptional regulator [Pseudonocardia acidicola]
MTGRAEFASTTAAGIAAEAAGIAATGTSIEQRAEALLTPLQRIMPFQATYLALLDPEQHEHHQLVVDGYDEATQRYLHGPALLQELELVGLTRPGPPMRVRDLPIPPGEIPIWAQHLWPAGLREALGIRLYTPSGTCQGLLVLHTDTPAYATDAARDLAGRLAPLIAHAVDPMRQVSTLAGIVRKAVAGVVLTRFGHVLPLGRLPGHRLLRTRSAVALTAARHLDDGADRARFLCPDTGHHLLRVTALRCPPQPPHHLWAIVLLSPPEDLHGLTPFDLTILGLLLDGWPDWRIAAWLHLAEGTITGRIPHITAMLGATDRAPAISRAARLGLYIPRMLIKHGHEPVPGC